MAPLSAGITHRLLRTRAVASEVARAAAVVAGVRRPTVSRRLWALPARRAARGGHVPKGTVCVCVCARARVCVRACVCARVCVKVARTLSCARAARSCCTALASSKPTRNGRCRRSCDTTSLSLRPPLRPPLCSPLCSPLCFSLCVRSPLCSSELRFDLVATLYASAPGSLTAWQPLHWVLCRATLGQGRGPRKRGQPSSNRLVVRRSHRAAADESHAADGAPALAAAPASQRAPGAAHLAPLK